MAVVNSREALNLVTKALVTNTENNINATENSSSTSGSTSGRNGCVVLSALRGSCKMSVYPCDDSEKPDL